PRAAERWERDLAILRAVAAQRVLGREAAISIDTRRWLDDLELSIAAVGAGDGHMPLLRARRRTSSVATRLDALASTALVELLAAERVAGVVTRCGGVRPASTPSLYGEAADAEFARRAGLTGLVGQRLSQCPHLVAAPRRGSYCSKACSNAAFAL